MKTRFFIGVLLLTASNGWAQGIAHSDIPAPYSTIVPAAAESVSGALEQTEYKVSYLEDLKAPTFEIRSPKATTGDVKLVTIGGDDVCKIHKGPIREGKNLFTLKSKKLSKGIYYVVSKLANGEQFADKIVVAK